MKTKSPSKKAGLSSAIPQKSNSADKIPACLKPFAGKTPTEILKMVSSLLAPKNSGGAKSLEGLYSGNPLPRLAYTMRETAAILGVSYITVHRLLKRGKIRSSDAIRNKVIPHTEIERFLKESIATD